MNKKDVLIVGLLRLNSMAKHGYLNKDSGVSNVLRRSSGNRRTIGSIAGGTGLSYGSMRTTTCVSFPDNQATASRSLRASKTFGYRNRLRRSIITGTLNTSSMMQHTSTGMAAL